MSAGEVGRREEDADGCDDEGDGEYPEEEPVDDHGGELPVARDLVRLVVVLDLTRDEAQLVEDGEQLVAHVVQAALLEARAPHVHVVDVDGDRVVHVPDVRQQAARRRVARLQLAHMRLL